MRVIFLILFFNGSLLSAQQMITLNGEISDAANGESLIGAVVYIKQLGEVVIYYRNVTMPNGEKGVGVGVKTPEAVAEIKG